MARCVILHGHNIHGIFKSARVLLERWARANTLRAVEQTRAPILHCSIAVRRPSLASRLCSAPRPSSALPRLFSLVRAFRRCLINPACARANRRPATWKSQQELGTTVHEIHGTYTVSCVYTHRNAMLVSACMRLTWDAHQMLTHLRKARTLRQHCANSFAAPVRLRQAMCMCTLCSARPRRMPEQAHDEAALGSARTHLHPRRFAPLPKMRPGCRPCTAPTHEGAHAGHARAMQSRWCPEGDHFREPRRRPSVRKPGKSEWEGAQSNRKLRTGSEVECSGRRVFGTLCTMLPGCFGFVPSVSRASAMW